MLSLRRILQPRNPARAKCDAVGHDWDHRGHVTVVFDPSFLWQLRWVGESRCLRCSKLYAPSKAEYYDAPSCWSHLGKVLDEIAVSADLDPRYLQELESWESSRENTCG